MTPLKVGIYVLEIDRVVGEHRQVFDAQRAALDAGALGRVVDRFVAAESVNPKECRSYIARRVRARWMSKTMTGMECGLFSTRRGIQTRR